MSSDDDYVKSIVGQIKARDIKQVEDLHRAQHDAQLKRAKGKEVFESLKVWLKEISARISVDLDRPVVRYQEDREGAGLKLIGEGSDTNYVEVKLAEDGTIKYRSIYIPDGQASFLPSVENGDQVRYKNQRGVLSVADMGKILMDTVTLTRLAS